MSSNEIRKSFIKYFKSKEHMEIPSSSLIPHDDETLLFTNAGMVQFKDVFLGLNRLPYKKAVTVQKCVRAGGKHNDLENVGKTARHHTFFEMLGNFSFGDYFKREAISYSWEYLTKVLELPPNRLYVTVYLEDDEAYDLWHNFVKLPSDKIIRLGDEDNFWSMGEIGPCGPCSEVFIDRGEKYSCGASECGIGKCDCDRWYELWNLVFMQYERSETGTLSLLPKPSIDTGMGLERVATIMQGVDSNYDTDLLRPIISQIEKKSKQKYYTDERGFPFRVISDHIRACTFLIVDGVLPSNEGRGYVLRRILRRATRFCKVLGFEKTVLHELVPSVISIMGDTYPDIIKMQDYIQEVIKSEEERFINTLNEGMKIVNGIIADLKSKKEYIINGKDVFKLYDTYGFPLDLTEDIAEENGLKVDKSGFEKEMAEQKTKARNAQEEQTKDMLTEIISEKIEELPPVEFTGYGKLSDTGRVVALINKDKFVKIFEGVGSVKIILDRTPFYAESGGQIGDIGHMENKSCFVKVDNTVNIYGKTVHICTLKNGHICIGDELNLVVNKTARYSTARNHTATHLLHKALKMVLGEQVRQSGSFVGPKGLRFDFNHFSSLSDEEIDEIEKIINSKIMENIPVITNMTTTQEALKNGAIALFGEKYGEEVRVVDINSYSKELCGGTHVNNTSEIGLFKIINEGSIGSGLRRIEAITSLEILNQFKSLENKMGKIASSLNVNPENLFYRIKTMEETIKLKEKEIQELQDKLANASVDSILQNAVKIDKTLIICTDVNVSNVAALRNMADIIDNQTDSSIIILGAIIGNGVNFVVKVTEDLVQKNVHAGKIIKSVAEVVGGSGGGRADMAQAGGKNKSNLNKALKIGLDIAKGALS
ncbi:MAG TPA: alanine--tRNA ligase [Thermoanaerobacterales bacterium]|nr:alanine--tRNA ligase [Thermoanaerobacterales bacterium]